MNFIKRIVVFQILLVALTLSITPIVYAEENNSFVQFNKQAQYSYEFPKTVQLVINSKRLTYITSVETVGDLIAEQRIQGEISYTTHSATTKLITGLVVTIKQRITVVTLEDVAIPFSKKQWYVNDLKNGEKRIAQKGENGIKLVQKEKVYEGNTVVSEKVLYEEVVKNPVTERTEVGTTKRYKVLDLPDGDKLQYIRELYVRATSYDHSCKGCNYTTATGRYLTKGIVAVDPKVIPMHTHMYIPGYGYGQAEDTGGAVKGNRIDLAYDDIRYGDWHAQWVTIYILD